MKIMRTPRSLDLEVTSRCNLRCKYCSHFTSEGDVEDDLPLAEWLAFFAELKRCAVIDVCLQGGEPFFREDFKELLQGVVRNRMRFSILTNGTLITDEIAAFLASTGRCNAVQVSIDGSVPFTHDAFRGEGNFRRALNGLQCLLAHGLSATVRVTIHRKNVLDLEAVAKFLLEEVGLQSFSTNAASHFGLCRKNSEQVQLTVEERSLAMETLLKLSQKYPGRIEAQAGPLAEATGWLEMEQARCQDKDQLPNRGYLTACGGVMSKMAIRADGIMIPCAQLPHMELGRINRDDLGEVWRKNSEFNRLRDRVKIPLTAFDYCRTCDYANYCTGNCPALAHTMSHDAWCPSPEGCLKRFLEAGGWLPQRGVKTW